MTFLIHELGRLPYFWSSFHDFFYSYNKIFRQPIRFRAIFQFPFMNMGSPGRGRLHVHFFSYFVLPLALMYIYEIQITSALEGKGYLRSQFNLLYRYIDDVLSIKNTDPKVP